MKERMKEPHTKGVAIHGVPESCGVGRKAGFEALTGAHAGTVLSREIRLSRAPTLLSKAEGNMDGVANARRRSALRGRRPVARVEPSCARTGRSFVCRVDMAGWAASGRQKP